MDNTTEYQLDDKQIKVAVSLYRHLFWADNLRMQFETVLVRDRSEMEKRMRTQQVTFEPKLLESEICLCLWLGCLYSVIEGWSRLNVNEPRINKLLEKGYKKKLHDFRNAVFHPVDYDDDRIKALVATGQPSIEWARNVTKEFKKFFESILLRGEQIQ